MENVTATTFTTARKASPTLPAEQKTGDVCPKHHKPLFRLVNADGSKGTVRACRRGCIYELNSLTQIWGA
jgi:hypothetical protein